MAGRNPAGPSGVRCDVLDSAFQKAVRRGETELAVWALRELAGISFNRALLRALYVAQEDVGSCDMLEELAAVKDGDLTMLMRLAVTMCRMPKTRAPCWLQRVVATALPSYKDQLPKGSLLGSLRDLPLVEAAVMCRVGLTDARAHRDAVQELRPSLIPALVKRGYHPMTVYCALLWHRGIVPSVPYTVAPESDVPPAGGPAPVIPDYVYCKHTLAGKQAGRDMVHFLSEGCKITVRIFPEGQDPFEAEARASYTQASKRTAEFLADWLGSPAHTQWLCELDARAPPRKPAAQKRKVPEPGVAEAGKAAAPLSPPAKRAAPAPAPAQIPPLLARQFTHILRAQLITAAHKPPVYFAHSAHRGNVVIKGPMRKKEDIDEMLASEALKRVLKLPTTGLERLHGGDGEQYLLARCVVSYDPSKWKVCSSTLETAVNVYDGDMQQWKVELLKSDKLTIGLMLVLALRYVMGSVDACPRNVLVYGGYVYSVDDPLRMDPRRRPMWGRPQHKALYEAALSRTEVWRGVQAELWEWPDRLKSALKDGSISQTVHDFVSARVPDLYERKGWVFI